MVGTEGRHCTTENYRWVICGACRGSEISRASVSPLMTARSTTVLSFGSCARSTISTRSLPTGRAQITAVPPVRLECTWTIGWSPDVRRMASKSRTPSGCTIRTASRAREMPGVHTRCIPGCRSTTRRSELKSARTVPAAKKMREIATPPLTRRFAPPSPQGEGAEFATAFSLGRRCREAADEGLHNRLLMFRPPGHPWNSELPFERGELIQIDGTDDVDDGQFPWLCREDHQPGDGFAARLGVDLHVVAPATLYRHDALPV